MISLAPTALLALLLAPAGAIPLADRLAEAEAALAAAVEATDAGDPIDADALSRARSALSESGDPWLEGTLADEATTTDGQRESIADALARVRAARAEARAAASAESAASEAATAEGERARSLAKEVLAERQFQERAVDDHPAEPTQLHVIDSFWQRLWNALERWWNGRRTDEPSLFWTWLADVAPSLASALRAVPWRVVGFGVLCALAVALVLLAARYLRVPRLSMKVGPQLLFEGDSLISDALRHEAGHFLAEGARLLARGDVRGAIRAYYTGVLSALHHRRVLRLDPWRTNWEHMTLLRTRPDLHARVVPFTRTFDLAWYGRLPVERDRAVEIAAFLEELSAPKGSGR